MLGVGIFGTFTGYLANLFLAPRTRQAARTAVAASTGTNARLDELRQLVARQRVLTEELERLSSESG